MEYNSGKWQRYNVEKLILLIQEYECLYSANSKDYEDRTKKAQAFNDIQMEMEEDIDGVTVDVIKKKWKSLRTQYFREKRLIESSKKSGNGRSDVYEPKLWCFDQLSFLEMDSKLNESEDNVDTQSSEIADTAMYAEVKRDLGHFKKMISKRKQGRKFAWLANLVETQMEELDPDHQQTAAWEIQMAIQKFKAMD